MIRKSFQSALLIVAMIILLGIIFGRMTIVVLIILFLLFCWLKKNDVILRSKGEALLNSLIASPKSDRVDFEVNLPQMSKKDNVTYKKLLAPWVYEEIIPREVAEGVIKNSAWWLTHSSGYPVRAPRHASRMYKSPTHGWLVEFGANSFLVGKAVQRARKRILIAEEKYNNGISVVEREIKSEMQDAICQSVSNVNQDEYDYYPLNGRELVFGAQAIDVDDAIRYLSSVSGVDNLYKDAA